MSCISDKIVDDILSKKGWTLDKNFDEICTNNLGDEIRLYTAQNELAEEKLFNLLVFLQVVVLLDDPDKGYQFALDIQQLPALESNLRYYGNADRSSLSGRYGKWVRVPYIKVISKTSNTLLSFKLFNKCPIDDVIVINTMQRKIAYAGCYLEGYLYLLKKKKV